MQLEHIYNYLLIKKLILKIILKKKKVKSKAVTGEFNASLSMTEHTKINLVKIRL